MLCTMYDIAQSFMRSYYIVTYTAAALERECFFRL